ncbi:MAG: hypothetical protein EBZ49_12745 [Proteobacteria bacterium]|nr:hypothetical protein [Pseudomonadota bacterium]
MVLLAEVLHDVGAAVGTQGPGLPLEEDPAAEEDRTVEVDVLGELWEAEGRQGGLRDRPVPGELGGGDHGGPGGEGGGRPGAFHLCHG